MFGAMSEDADLDFDKDTCFHAQVSDAPTAMAMDEVPELVELDFGDDLDDEDYAGQPEESPELPPRSWKINPCDIDLQPDTIKAFRELAKLKVEGFATLDSDENAPPRRTWKIETKNLVNNPEVLAALQKYIARLQSKEEDVSDDEEPQESPKDVIVLAREEDQAAAQKFRKIMKKFHRSLSRSKFGTC
eukprot:TRINITY_DN106763_c0_g1_i1.p2 TRINITY_DN106763_c0_g1~~TRINITY_DN106763_c0_g1_i1.p2  ORF type:complete len:189 (+),score=61.01 TRINITY_DN106763_c0_g1_i1:74-640(+)